MREHLSESSSFRRRLHNRRARKWRQRVARELGITEREVEQRMSLVRAATRRVLKKGTS